FRAIVLVWPLLCLTAEVVVYYTLPFSGHFRTHSAIWLLVGIVAFGLLLFVQITRTARSAHPRMRAVAAILTSLPVFLLLFAAAYYVGEQTSPHTFNQSLSRTDAIYFATTVFSTVGFGDIVPTSEPARVLVMFQMIGDLVLIGVLGRVVVAAVGVGLARRDSSASPDGPGGAA
ncbi:MAG TPA: potassium channel family protein, partial [Mycobacteriales bacterium]|nr:potassium channel family protein [Mycobacteriales bacterium]